MKINRALSCIVYAPNIHQGGGRVLLLPVIECLQGRPDTLFVLDARLFPKDGWPEIQCLVKVEPTLSSRLLTEWRLRSWINDNVRILCMGNLPPLLGSAGKQSVFVQNRYLIDKMALDQFPLPVQLRIKFERWWLKARSRYVRRFIVQTSTMKRLLDETLGAEASVLPFAELRPLEESPNELEPEYDFLYVATGEPHKNHRVLIEAWIELAGKGLFPTLCLTLDQDRFPELYGWIIRQVDNNQLKVTMAGECSHQAVIELYRQSRALIYPSTFESFGLPLIEAAQLKMPVLASEASYVTDVIRPTAQFNPASPHALAQAAQNFSFQPASLAIDLLSADGFLERALL